MSPDVQKMADRIRAVIGTKSGITEKKMFGGVGFMLNGNMLAGVTKDGTPMIRIDPARQEEAARRTGAMQLRMGERQMTGFLGVAKQAIADDAVLADWIAFAEAYVKTLPPK